MKKIPLLFVLFFLFSSFSAKKITWVAIGDSITYLNDHKNETGNRITKGYMTMVTEKLPHIEFINQGHNGWTSQRAFIPSIGIQNLLMCPLIQKQTSTLIHLNQLI